MPPARVAVTSLPVAWPGYDALIFDWDGTLADSHAANFQAMQAALRRHGGTLEFEWFASRTGMSSPDMIALLARTQRLDLDIDRVAAERDQEYLALIGEVRPIGAVIRVLKAAAGTVKTALATGGGPHTVLATVDRLRLRHLFDVIITRADVELGKPAPDIFLETARRLNLEPHRCLVFEDSDEGLQAAAAAGMDSVDVRQVRAVVTDADGGRSHPA